MVYDASASVVISALFLYFFGNFLNFFRLINRVRVYHRNHFCPCALSLEMVIRIIRAYACLSRSSWLFILAWTVSA